MVSNADINGDGIEDLIVLINTKAIQLSKTATEAELLGQTITGMGWRRAFSAGRAATARYVFPAYERKLAALAALKKSLLNEAFTGKL